MRVSVVGGAGFIGSAVCEKLEKLKNITLVKFTERITENSVIRESFKNVDVIVYCAGVAHFSKASSNHIKKLVESDFISASRFFACISNLGIKRIIYISSVNVFGGSTKFGSPFTYDSVCSPVDLASRGKLAIERSLINKTDNFEFVILRSPLVYGLGVKANFMSLMDITKKRLPLPFGAISNKRSLVALDNLVDLIITCIDHPKAANQTFLVSDDQDVSTTELLQMMTRAAGKTPRLIPVPVSWLRFIAKITGKQAIIERLCGNLQVDITHTKETLGWKPPVTVEEGIARCFAPKG